MEITRSIGQYKLLAKVVNSFLKSLFYIIRIVSSTFAYKEGNIVIISLHKLGDTVFTIPAIREIQKSYRKKIIILCYPEVIPIYKIGLNDLDFCEVDHKNFYFHDRIAGSKARKMLRSKKPEVIFDLTGVMTSATLIFNSRAKKIIGMNREQFKTLYDFYTPIRTNPHLMDRYIDVVATVIPNLNREQIKNFPVNINQEGKILIHPFGGWKAKEWNLNKFISLATRLREEYNVSLIAPVNRFSNDIIDELMEKKIDVIETRSIEELIEQIKQCFVFVGNDSGPVHIASLLGKPTFTIYGPTNPDYHVPYGEHHAHCKIEIACSPKPGEKLCFTDGGRSGCPSFECMNQLSSEKVTDNLLNFLENLDKHVITKVL